MPFEISTTREFAAAHAIQLYDGSLEPVHGHNWRVRVVVGSAGLDSIGVVMDFHDLEHLVDAIIASWHNRHLNEMAPFFVSGHLALNPTTEHIALHVGESIAAHLPAGVSVKCVDVWETANCRARYVPDQKRA